MCDCPGGFNGDNCESEWICEVVIRVNTIEEACPAGLHQENPFFSSREPFFNVWISLITVHAVDTCVCIPRDIMESIL